MSLAITDSLEKRFSLSYAVLSLLLILLIVVVGTFEIYRRKRKKGGNSIEEHFSERERDLFVLSDLLFKS